MANDFKRLYPIENGSYGNVSTPFIIDRNPVHIATKGFHVCDYLIVEFWFGDECDGSWEPFKLCKASCCGCPGLFEIDSTVNNFFMNIPGKYRIILMNTDGEDAGDPNWFSDIEIIMNVLPSTFDITHYL